MIAMSAVYYAFSYNTRTYGDIEVQKQIWDQTKPQNYSYTIFNGCMFVQKSEVMVIFGKVNIKPPEEGEPEGSRSGLVIENLFEKLEKAMSAAELSVDYHRLYGFPTKISVDWSAGAVDDECFYSVSDFELLE
ncbi:DUF6174 domain-containing protein [Aliikangiella sp. IMCC44653]